MWERVDKNIRRFDHVVFVQIDGVYAGSRMADRTIPPGLDRNGPGRPAGPGRRPYTVLLRWAIRWIQFILRRCHVTRRSETALILAAAALASAEEPVEEAQIARGRLWLDSLRGGHIADLRGTVQGRWIGGQDTMIV